MLILRDVTPRPHPERLRRGGTSRRRILEVSGALVLRLGMDGEVLLLSGSAWRPPVDRRRGRRKKMTESVRSRARPARRAFQAFGRGASRPPREPDLTARDEERTVPGNTPAARRVMRRRLRLRHGERSERPARLERRHREQRWRRWGRWPRQRPRLQQHPHRDLGSLDIAQRAITADCTGRRPRSPTPSALGAGGVPHPPASRLSAGPRGAADVNLANVVREVGTLFSQTIAPHRDHLVHRGRPPLALADPTRCNRS
jgi:hypothetical protein